MNPENASACVIRDACRDDAGLMLRFIRELADYEEAADQVVATEQDLAASLFGPDSNSAAVICERAGQPVGFAVYFFSYSTWQGRHGLYLEDLYVTPDARGSGAGSLLLRHLAALAVARGCGRFEWSVLDWNKPARAFYEAMGAEPQLEWVRYRLEGDALRAFAAAD